MRKPQWYYGWNVIAITLLFQSLTIGMHYYCFTLWVVPWSRELGADRGTIMLAITASLVISGAISPLAGRALDRLPSHWLVCGGAVIYAVGMLFIAAAQSVWHIILVYTLILPLGLVLTGAMAAQTLATRWFTKDRGFAIASSTLGTSVGGFTFPPIAAALLALVGWRLTFLILALVSVLLITPVAWRVLRRMPPQEETKYTFAATATETVLLADQQKWTTAGLLRNRGFRILVVGFLPLSLAFSGIQMNLGGYTHDLGFSQQQTSFLISLLSIFMLVGKVLFGKLADNFDHRVLYWGIAAGVAAAIVTLSAGTSYTALAVGTSLLGLAYAGFLPLVGSIIASHFGTRAFGQAMGLSSTFLSAGSAGSFIAGWLRDQSGSYGIAFLSFLVLMAPAALLVRKLEPPRRHTAPAH